MHVFLREKRHVMCRFRRDQQDTIDTPLTSSKRTRWFFGVSPFHAPPEGRPISLHGEVLGWERGGVCWKVVFGGRRRVKLASRPSATTMQIN